MKGIDVSENNGAVDWGAVKSAGFEFAIIRLGYGRGTLDGKFYDNINGALNAGLKIGVYHYSYALSDYHADLEADFFLRTLQQSGLTPDKLELGVWFDMEDADGYKANRGVTAPQVITNMCSVFINRMWRSGYTFAGVYANLDWLTNYIYVDQLANAPVWCAQYAGRCDYPNAYMWQYTDSESIAGKLFDANIVL